MTDTIVLDYSVIFSSITRRLGFSGRVTKSSDDYSSHNIKLSGNESSTGSACSFLLISSTKNLILTVNPGEQSFSLNVNKHLLLTHAIDNWILINPNEDMATVYIVTAT